MLCFVRSKPLARGGALARGVRANARRSLMRMAAHVEDMRTVEPEQILALSQTGSMSAVGESRHAAQQEVDRF
jgi:hypothetical protein